MADREAAFCGRILDAVILVVHNTCTLPTTADTRHTVLTPKEPTMIRETTYTGARKHLATLMDQVIDTHEPVLIRRRGKEPVALIAAEDLSSWMETDYLLRSPKNAERLRESMARADAGEGEPVDINELRERLGLSEE